MHISVPHVCLVPRKAEEGTLDHLDHLDLEVWTIRWLLGTEPGPSAGAASTINC